MNNAAFYADNTPGAAPGSRFARLTPAAQGQRGQVWLTQRVWVKSGFRLTFDFMMTGASFSNRPEPADGFCAVFQNEQLQAGGGGGGMGYDSIKDSLAVCVDTFSFTQTQYFTTNVYYRGVTPQFIQKNYLVWNPVDGQRHTMDITRE